MKAVLKCLKCGGENFDNLSPEKNLTAETRLKCSSCGCEHSYEDLRNDAIRRALEELPRETLDSMMKKQGKDLDPALRELLLNCKNSEKK